MFCEQIILLLFDVSDFHFILLHNYSGLDFWKYFEMSEQKQTSYSPILILEKKLLFFYILMVTTSSKVRMVHCFQSEVTQNITEDLLYGRGAAYLLVGKKQTNKQQ